MIAGQLELQLIADVARLRQDMDAARGIVNRGATQMQKALDDVRGAMSGLFSGLSAAAFGMWIKSAIDFQDELNDLNKTTDISIGRLAGLSLMSKQTGSDLTGTAGAMNKLVLEMGKAPEKFAKIGISAKDPLEAFKQMSELFRQIEDPQLRAAVAAEGLGLKWQAAAPALAEGANEIERMVKRGQELAMISTEDAQAADLFNDRLSELQISLMGTAAGISRSMLPLLTEFVTSLTEVTHEANTSAGQVSLLTESLRAIIVLAGNVAFVVHGMAVEVGGLTAQMETLLRLDFSSFLRGLGSLAKLLTPAATAAALMRGDFAGAKVIGEEMANDAAKNAAKFAEWEKRMMGAGTATVALTEEQRELQRELARMGDSSKRVSDQMLRDFIDNGAASKAAAKALEKELEQQQRLLMELHGLSGSFLQDWDRLSAMFARGALSVKQLTEEQAKLLAKQPMAVALAKEQEEALKRLIDAQEEEEQVQREVNEAINDEQKKRADQITSAQEMLKNIQFETSALTMTNVEREKAIALRELERTGLDKSSQAYRDLASAITLAVEQREAVRQSMEVWSDIEAMAHDTWNSIFTDGENTFKKLGQSLNTFFLDLLYQMTVKQWMVNIQASFNGSGGVSRGGAGMSGGGIGGSGVGGGGAFGNMDNFGYGGLYQYFTNTGATQAGSDMSLFYSDYNGTGGTSGATGVGMEGMIASASPYIAAAVAAANGQYWTAALTAVGTAIYPGIGTAIGAAIGSLADAYVGQSTGGDKVEGYYIPYETPASPGRPMEWSTRNDFAGQALSEAIALGAQGGFDSVLAAYDKKSNLKFGVGVIRDPLGEAQTIGHVGLGQGNQGIKGQIFEGHNEGIGRSDEEFTQAMADMTGRAFLVGLQKVGLDGMLGDYLKELGDVVSLTADSVADAVARLQKASNEKIVMDEQIYQMTHTSEEKLLRQRQGEMDAIDESNEALLRRVWQLQDEQAAAATLAQALDQAAASSREWMGFIGGINTGIRQYIDHLEATDDGMLSSGDQLGNAKDQFREQIKLARAGDRTALENITQYAEQLRQSQVDHTASGPQTRATVEMIERLLESLPDMETSEEYLARIIQEAADKEIEEGRDALFNARDKIWEGLWGSAGLLNNTLTLLDENGDSILDFDELKVALGPMASDKTIRKLIARADENGDGQLSQLEIINASVIDTNGIVKKEMDHLIEHDEKLSAEYIAQQKAISDQRKKEAEELLKALGGGGYGSSGTSGDGNGPGGGGGTEMRLPTRHESVSYGAGRSRGNVRDEDTVQEELQLLRADVSRLTTVVAHGLGRTARASEETAANLRHSPSEIALRKVASK